MIGAGGFIGSHLYEKLMTETPPKGDDNRLVIHCDCACYRKFIIPQQLHCLSVPIHIHDIKALKNTTGELSYLQNKVGIVLSSRGAQEE